MNKITITLKQHTPLLHFQPTQEGATLRASEVKPKLDKFLLKKLGGDDYEAGVAQARENGWLIGDSNALNYKMRIASSGKLDIELDEDPRNAIPMILSNMGKEYIETDLAMFSNNIVTMTFSSDSKSTSLLQFIIGKSGYSENSKLLQTFFVLNNFGQRTTKGFGSFTMSSGDVQIGNSDNVEPLEIEAINSRLMPSETPYMIFDLPKGNEYNMQKAMFSVIDFYWKVLKSGVNYTQKGKFEERYIKSFLYIYLKSKDKTWEKKFLKKNLSLTKSFDDNRGSNNNLTPSFARALLGLPELYEYRNVWKKVEVEPTVKNEDDTIERIASPIVFKPIKVNSGEPRVCVFILFDTDIIEKIKNTPERFLNFTFVSKDIDDKKRSISKSAQLSIDAQCIDYKELIKSYHQYLNDNEELQVDDYNDRVALKMTPLDFGWRKILFKAKTNYVVFKKTL